MARFKARVLGVILLMGAGVAGCIGPPIDDEVGKRGEALIGVAQETCQRAMMQQYVECRELDCQLDPLIVTGYENLCERDCAAEAATAYRECAADAATATAWTGPTAADLRQFTENPDDVIRMHAGPTDEPCINCAW